jgi:endonuclease YncB( thermonuclease family)
LLLAVLLAAACGGPLGASPTPQGVGANDQLRPVGPLEEAVVTRVVDGDTIVVRIGGQQMRLRYIGIDAPEMGDPGPEPWGREATDANERLVAGQRVHLERDISDTDRFGRLLRYVWLRAQFNDGTETWTMVNRELVSLGVARAVSFPPDVQHQEVLRAAEREARDAAVGLWGEQP